MFRAYHIKYVGDQEVSNIFFDDTLEQLKIFSLIDPTLKTEVGKAGSFSFKLPITNTEFDQFEDIVSYVDLYRGDDLIFSGRVFGVGPKDFYGQTNIYCEGLLAVFNDSIFEPIIFNGTLNELLTAFLEQHNDQVDDPKKVYLGKVTVEDNYVYRAYENYEPTIDRLDDIVDSYGGYMSVRKENGLLYLDYLQDFEEISNQTIDFGENLLDITQETDVSELATVLIPFGGDIQNEDGSSTKVDITSVNLGLNYIENIEAISQYGRIWKVHEWSDVTVPTILRKKAVDYLAEISQPKVSIDVSAVDMAKAGSNINYFKAGQYVHVHSTFHNVDRNILVKSQDLKLLDPASNTMTLSDKFTGFIGKTNKNITNINKSIDVIYTKTEGNSVKNEDLQNQINIINEAGFLNEEGVVGLYNTLIEDINGKVNTQTALLEAANGQIQILIDTNNLLNKYFEFGENGLIIRSVDDAGNYSNVYSIQDEQSYKYVDSSGEKVLLEINAEGIVSDTVEVKKQVSFSEGAIKQWAIRHGDVDQNGMFNLNDVWIGG